MASEALVPPPSIGESKPATGKSGKASGGKKGSKLWLVVLGCVVVGVGLGVFVYQQSIAPPPKPSPTPRPAVTPKPATPTPVPSPVIPEVSQVTPQGNTISFPKAGEIRVYYSNYEGTATTLLDMESNSGGVGVTLTGNGSGNTMVYKDTGLVLGGAEQVTVGAFDGGDYSKPAYGWIPPDASNRCGGDGTTAKPDITPYTDWVTTQAGGEPIVSVQCWGDWGPSGDTSNADFNDYLVIWSYNPDYDPNASPSPSASASPSPSASAGVSPSPSSTATATPTPTPTPAGGTDASPRVTMPEGETLPDAGVFEVTVGTMGIGILLLIVGLAGLLIW